MSITPPASISTTESAVIMPHRAIMALVSRDVRRRWDGLGC